MSARCCNGPGTGGGGIVGTTEEEDGRGKGGKSSPVVHGRNSGFPNYFYPPVCE